MICGSGKLYVEIEKSRFYIIDVFRICEFMFLNMDKSGMNSC